MTTLLLIIAAYLIGSISFAVVVSKFYGLADPRTYGSGNPGATNVLRSGNKGAAIWTLIGDAFKGWLAVFLVDHFQEQLGLGAQADQVIALVAVAVFLGHLWPVFFKFVGGKGVATALGVLLALKVELGLATLAVWLLVAYATRYSSLAALIASVFAPLYFGMRFGTEPELAAVLAMSGLLIWRHSKNIANLIAGKESRIGSKAKKKA